jgi:CheY-like chemotaxis protein
VVFPRELENYGMTGSKLILIIEDNEDFQYLYGLVADSAGYAVEAIYNGEEALKRLECEPVPSLVLLDTRLPGADGDVILRAARSKEKWGGVPIYMVTADMRAAQSYQNYSPGEPHADGVIEKGPDSIRRLRELFESYQEKTAG